MNKKKLLALLLFCVYQSFLLQAQDVRSELCKTEITNISTYPFLGTGTTYGMQSSYDRTGGNNDGFPRFSWDHVSLYAHIGVGAGLEPDQYNFLADNFDLICLSGGILSASSPVSIETNITAGATTIKKRNPNAKVLMYWASDLPKHQWKISNASFPANAFLSINGELTQNLPTLTMV